MRRRRHPLRPADGFLAHHASLPVAYRLYMPKEWVTDRTRRRKAGVPKEITFKTKPATALDHLRWACAAGLPRGAVLTDAGYSTDTALRGNIIALGLSYVAGIQPHTSVWVAWNWAAAAEEVVGERATSKVAAAG
jgi:SRSO17 transposase